MDFSLFHVSHWVGTALCSTRSAITLKCPCLEGLGDLSALKPAPMPPGCPRQASLSSLVALLSISAGFGLFLSTRLFHDGKDQIFGPRFVIHLTKFISGSDLRIFERRSPWLSKQCLDFTRGKGKETLSTSRTPFCYISDKSELIISQPIRSHRRHCLQC